MPITKKNGFTLVEIAIALVIVGLLTSGALVGQEMVTNAKLKRIESNNAGIAAAIFSYQDRYLRLPGDDSGAKTRFSIYTDTINDPAAADINGDSSGSIDGSWLGAANSETSNVWKHLRAAGLIPGSGDDDTQPPNAFGGTIGLRDGSLLIAGHVLVCSYIEGPVAKILEHRLDDGVPATGRVQSDISAALMDGTNISSSANYVDSLRYFMAFRL